MDAPLWIHHSKAALVLEFASCSLTLHTPAQKGVEASHIQTSFSLASRPDSDTLDKSLHWKGLGCLGVATVDKEHYVVIATKATAVLPSATSTSAGLESAAVVCDIRFFSLGHPTKSSDATHFLHPCHDLHKLLTAGQTYISLDPAYDLTARVESFDAHVPSARDPSLYAPAEEDFVANHAWLQPLRAFRERLKAKEQDVFDRYRVGMVMMHGFIGLRELTLADEECTLAVISRRAHQREGTRFAERGIDSQGFVASYAETETLLLFQDRVGSFVQVRGSVPVFWTERGALGSQPAARLLHASIEQEQRAITKHFTALTTNYGTEIECVSLLDPIAFPSEKELSHGYEDAVNLMAHDNPSLGAQVKLKSYNINQLHITKGLPNAELGFRGAIKEDFERAGMTVVAYALEDVAQWSKPTENIQRQRTVFRTNCRDCLDRTNLAQGQISLIAVNKYLMSTSAPSFEDCQALERAHRALFGDNGEALSRIATGAPALYLTYMREGRLSRKSERADKVATWERNWNFMFEDRRKEVAFGELEAEDVAFSLARD